MALFKCRKVLSSPPESPGTPILVVCCYISNYPKHQGLKQQCIVIMYQDSRCRVGKAQQRLTSLGPQLGQLGCLGADQASLPHSVGIVLHVGGLGFPTAWQPQGSHPLSMVAWVSMSRDEEAGSLPVGKAWSWQSDSSPSHRPAQIPEATWTFTLNRKNIK